MTAARLARRVARLEEWAEQRPVPEEIDDRDLARRIALILSRADQGGEHRDLARRVALVLSRVVPAIRGKEV